MPVNSRKMKTLKQAAVFILIAAALQALFMLFATSSGVRRLYPVAVLGASEKMTLGDNSYVEYFHIRERVTDRRLFVIGADTRIPETYDLLTDLIKYIKLNVNVTRIFLEIGATEAEQINECVAAADYETYSERLGILRDVLSVPASFYTFIAYLYEINTRTPPSGKLSVVGISGGVNTESAAEYLDEIFTGRYADFPREYKVAVKSKDIGGFSALFGETGEEYREALGEEAYQKIKAVCDDFSAAGEPLADRDAAERIASFISDEADDGRGYLALMDTSRTRYGTEFENAVNGELAELIPAVSLDIRYDNCKFTDENGDIETRSDISLPVLARASATYRLVDGERLAGFFAYDDGVASSFGRIADDKNSLKNFASDVYFIISDGGASLAPAQNGGEDAQTEAEG